MTITYEFEKITWPDMNFYSRRQLVSDECKTARKKRCDILNDVFGQLKNDKIEAVTFQIYTSYSTCDYDCKYLVMRKDMIQFVPSEKKGLSVDKDFSISVSSPEDIFQGDVMCGQYDYKIKDNIVSIFNSKNTLVSVHISELKNLGVC